MAKIDIVALEHWLSALPHDVDVTTWRHAGLDLWPVFKTALVGLSIHIAQARVTSGVRTGSLGWRAGVLADHFIRSASGRSVRSDKLQLQPLADRVLYYASGGHGRAIAGVQTVPSLDAVAALLRREGQEPAFLYEDLGRHDPLLEAVLHPPGYGLRDALQAARRSATRVDTRPALMQLAGFLQACDTAAEHIRLQPWFLLVWLTRQFNIVAAVANLFSTIFGRAGTPRLVVLLNGCSWSTAGLAAASKAAGAAVVEIQHGVESPSSITAPRQVPHFSRFNTAPDAFVSWETVDRGDSRVLPAGPLGLSLADLLAEPYSGEPERYSALRTAVLEQDEQLAARAKASRARREVLVTLQPGDRGDWLEPVLALLPPDIFFWIRRHSADVSGGPLPVVARNPGRADQMLATGALLSRLLLRSDVHLTRFSGATLEAAAMGVPTIATDPYARQLFSQLVPAHRFTVAVDSAETAGAVKQICLRARARHPAPQLEPLVPFIKSFIRMGDTPA